MKYESIWGTIPLQQQLYYQYKEEILHLEQLCRNKVESDIFLELANSVTEGRTSECIKVVTLINTLLVQGVKTEEVFNMIMRMKEEKIMPTKYGNLFNGMFELSRGCTQREPLFDKESIKKVIFKDPATIILWKDGTKTVVKCQKDKGDTYNSEMGLAMCIIKKMCGNKGNYNDVFNEWLPDNTQ